LRATRIVPTYGEKFRCVGSACEDTCCKGWSVPIDEAAYERYQGLAVGGLRSLLDASVLRKPDGGKGAKPQPFATIRMDGMNQCPLLSGERLCRVQTELGKGFLSHACATYPRIVHFVGNMNETALTLSCPEAARLVLLNPQPDLSASAGGIGEGHSHTEIEAEAAGVEIPAPAFFWQIRDTVVMLVRNRSYALWQRLFLLGVFCRRLDSIARGGLKRSVPDFLGDFEAAVGIGALRRSMETLPSDGMAQLDVVLRLAGMLLHRSNISPRFLECVNAFTVGIGNGPGVTLESLAAHYALAHDRSYASYFARNPHVLENYLLNTIFRCRFPFGREGMAGDKPACMTREFALLTAQFALVRGLLIGVAGFHREQFSAAHVVHTVQTAAKHFEHHPEFLNEAYALLVESGMDGARGLAILTRNVESRAAGRRGISPETHAASLQGGLPG